MKALPTFLLAALACFYSLQAEAVTITTPPQAVSILQGDAAVFVVQASGTGILSYQWKKNGIDIPGANNQSLVLNPTVVADAAAYSVAVSDTASSTATSSGAVLSFRTAAGGDLDLSFSGGAMINGSINAVVLQSDGKVIIGGAFSAVMGVARGGIARLNADGSTDYSYGNGLAGTNGTVRAMALQSDGKMLIAGDFSNVNGTSRNSIARLKSDGSLDASFGNGLTFDYSVSALAVQSDGKVLIGGSFTTVNGTTVKRVARLNSNGTLDTSFGSGLAGTDSTVSAVSLQSDGNVLIAGSFTTVNSTTVNRIARLNNDGTLDTSFGDGLAGANNSVYAMAMQSDGKLLIGGNFSTFNGTTINRIARLNNDGTLDTGFGNGLEGANFNVTALAIQSDGKVLMGGDFTTVNGTLINRIARLNSDGTLDMSFGNGLAGANFTVNTLAMQNDGKMFIGGDFSSVNDTTRNRIAQLNSDGTLNTAFGTSLAGAGANKAVNCLAVQNDGKMLIGGDFTIVNGVVRGAIARINSDGTLDTSFGNGLSGANNSVYSVALQSDGKVLIGGDFTLVNGTTRNRIARLNSDGTLDTTFGNSLTWYGAENTVYSVAFQSDGKALIGGRFTRVNSISRGSIARLNTDGTLDSSFGNGMAGAFNGINTSVNALSVQSDGKVLIGGNFVYVNAKARPCIARLNGDGTLDTSFGDGPTLTFSSYNSSVYTVGIQSDGRVLIGGYFDKVSGITLGSIARLNSDGTLDTSFGVGLSGANGPVSSVAVQSNGKVLIGGSFTRVNGAPRGGIARLNSVGSLDTSFGNGLAGVSKYVEPMALQSDGKVLIGGLFSSINGTTRTGFARLLGSSPAPDIVVAQTSALTDGVSSVDFGTLTLGSSSAAKTFTITNPGNADLNSLSMTKDGANAGDFTVSTLSGTSVPVGSSSVTFTVTFNPSASGARSTAIHIASNVSGTKNPFDITLTGTGQTIFAAWAASNTVANDPNGLGSNGIKNLLNFAFSVNPSTGSSGALVYTGIFAGSGTIASTGQPKVMMDPATNGTDIRGLFVRRKDAAAAGLTYTPQFSADLSSWQDSSDTPTVLADDGVNQIVSVPYPPLVGGQQAKFFRIQVTLAP